MVFHEFKHLGKLLTAAHRGADDADLGEENISDRNVYVVPGAGTKRNNTAIGLNDIKVLSKRCRSYTVLSI